MSEHRWMPMKEHVGWKGVNGLWCQKPGMSKSRCMPMKDACGLERCEWCVVPGTRDE